MVLCGPWLGLRYLRRRFAMTMLVTCVLGFPCKFGWSPDKILFKLDSRIIKELLRFFSEIKLQVKRVQICCSMDRKLLVDLIASRLDAIDSMLSSTIQRLPSGTAIERDNIGWLSFGSVFKSHSRCLGILTCRGRLLCLLPTSLKPTTSSRAS